MHAFHTDAEGLPQNAVLFSERQADHCMELLFINTLPTSFFQLVFSGIMKAGMIVLPYHKTKRTF